MKAQTDGPLFQTNVPVAQGILAHKCDKGISVIVTKQKVSRGIKAKLVESLKKAKLVELTRVLSNMSMNGDFDL
jgi:hypothetical protein